MPDKIRLTEELCRDIASGIRAGGYPHVAAEAFGVPKDVFDAWLEQGNRKNAWEPYRTFAREIRAAFAQARLRAESEELNKNPRMWLVNGPGRESEQSPGWSTSVKPAAVIPQARNVLTDPEIMQLLRAVTEALIPFPEARQQVADVLSKARMTLEEERSDGAASL
jgi:hypothetical protein